MPFEFANFGGGLQVPEPHGLVRAGRGHISTVRRKCDACHLLGVSLKFVQLLAVGHRPESDAFVVAGRGKCLAISRECDRVNVAWFDAWLLRKTGGHGTGARLLRIVEPADLLAGRRFPKSNGVIGTARG